MSLQHGFFSRDPGINPDSRMIASTAPPPTPLELVAAERYLHGDACADPIAAHLTAMKVWASGVRKYPSLWTLADRYASSQECKTMKKLANLPVSKSSIA